MVHQQFQKQGATRASSLCNCNRNRNPNQQLITPESLVPDQSSNLSMLSSDMAQRSQPLHNFVLPSRLKWGNQRHLRCMKPNPTFHLRSYSEKKDLSHDTNIQFERNQTLTHLVIQDFRAKLLLHLHLPAEKTFRVEQDETRKTPWNLRTRRSACKPPVPVKLHRNFSVSLSPDEIKDDFFIMTGNNPPRRPKKRAKLLQKQFDILSPGFWLNEITVDTYRVPDQLVQIKK